MIQQYNYKPKHTTYYHLPRSTYGHGYSGADSGYSAPSTGGGYAAPSAGYEAAAGYSSRASHFGDGEEEVRVMLQYQQHLLGLGLFIINSSSK